MIFEQLNPGSCLTYLVGSTSTKEVALVDPCIDYVDHYMSIFKDRGLTLKYAIDTHTHADHISACATLVDLTKCQYVMHELASPKCVTTRIKDGEELSLGEIKLKFIHTPGHTRDSVTLVIHNYYMITGDALFLDDAGAGRDDLPGGNPAEHWESLQKLCKLSDDLVVYPGHEYRSHKPSRLGHQKARNPFLQKNSKDDFVKFLESLRLGPADWMKEVLKANAACTRDPKAAYIPSGVSACEVMGTASTCSTTPGAAVASGFANVQAEEVQQKIKAGEDLLLLDVRELRELHSELGHIDGIVHIPINELQQRVGEITDQKDKTVISICKSGGRATRAAGILQEAGFNKILVMEGGMLRWNECGLPIKKPEHVS